MRVVQTTATIQQRLRRAWRWMAGLAKGSSHRTLPCRHRVSLSRSGKITTHVWCTAAHSRRVIRTVTVRCKEPARATGERTLCCIADYRIRSVPSSCTPQIRLSGSSDYERVRDDIAHTV